MDVRVGEEEELWVESGLGGVWLSEIALGVLGGDRHGMRFAEPTGGKGFDVQNGEAVRVLGGEAIKDDRGGVRGAVIDGDDAEVWVILGQQAAQRGLHRRGLVAGRDDHGKAGAPCRHRVPAWVEQVGHATEAEACGDGPPRRKRGKDPGIDDKVRDEGTTNRQDKALQN